MRVCFHQLLHPNLIILKTCIAIVEVLVKMAFQLVHELLLVETVKFLWNKSLVMT